MAPGEPAGAPPCRHAATRAPASATRASARAQDYVVIYDSKKSIVHTAKHIASGVTYVVKAYKRDELSVGDEQKARRPAHACAAHPPLRNSPRAAAAAPRARRSPAAASR